MSDIVHIVDYGVGNLYSVARAIEKCGGTPRLSADFDEIVAAERLVLPGVGAYKNGMDGLVENGLDQAVKAFAATGRPLLGICLGMQMFASQSVEFGLHRGLDLIPGKVVALPSGGPINGRKVPFVGWASLLPNRGEVFASTPLQGLSGDDAVYLVHSFHFQPDSQADLLATYEYQGAVITAAVARDNIFGCQFHPEKSGPVGLRILAKFLAS